MRVSRSLSLSFSLDFVALDAFRLATLLKADGYPFMAVLVPQGNQVAVVFSHAGMVQKHQKETDILVTPKNHRDYESISVFCVEFDAFGRRLQVFSQRRS